MSIIKSVGTGAETSCQENHTPTSMDDWATLSMHENSTIKCVTCVNMLEIVKEMSAQVTALQSGVSVYNRKIEKLSEKENLTLKSLN